MIGPQIEPKPQKNDKIPYALLSLVLSVITFTEDLETPTAPLNKPCNNLINIASLKFEHNPNKAVHKALPNKDTNRVNLLP